MKTGYGITIGMLLFLVFAFSTPLYAQQTSAYNSERRLSDLSQRFDSLEANWGRFQLGGNVTVDATNSFAENNLLDPMFSQQINLDLNAYIDRNMQFSLKLSQESNWGSGVILSPQVDEAFLKLETPNSLDYLGRFRFTFGPLGLISDFTTSPADGLAVQYKLRSYYLTGFYSRILNQYTLEDGSIMPTQNYYGFRLGWSNPNTLIGLNLIPKGVTGEKSFSFDISKNFTHSRIVSEIGWYAFQTTLSNDFQTDWTPGGLISYGVDLSAKDYFQIKLGYFSPNFRPTSSSLAHSSGENKEWFTFNTQGAELYYQHRLNKTLQLDNRLAALYPVEEGLGRGISYHLYSAIVKDFSPVNQLEFGVDLRTQSDSLTKQVSIKWNLRF